jgi:diacylglycerol kinase family enzyme
MRKIVYLINPISGTRGKQNIINTITDETTTRKIPFEIIHTNQDGNYDNLKKKIESDAVTDVVICGGDGTVSAVAGALLGLNIQIGIIPMGSGNGLALAAKIPAVTSKALDVIFTGSASWIDGFMVNNQFSCMLCGLGFDAQVAHDFSKEKRRGFQTYFKVSLRNLLKAKPFLFDITAGDQSFSTEAFFISIANGNQFGNNFTIAPEASLKDGRRPETVCRADHRLPTTAQSQSL